MDQEVLAFGVFFVYFFSVFGKMPMFLVDRNDPLKLVFFIRGLGCSLE